jgi:hypothetical protein
MILLRCLLVSAACLVLAPSHFAQESKTMTVPSQEKHGRSARLQGNPVCAASGGPGALEAAHADAPVAKCQKYN